jgi:hypothetical protein
MALYGDPNFMAVPKACGRGDGFYLFSAQFTWGAAGVISVDSAKTRGVISVVKGATGIVTITLPWALRNAGCQATIVSHPASAIVALPFPDHTEGSRTVTVNTRSIAAGALADGTQNIVVNVLIVGCKR